MERAIRAAEEKHGRSRASIQEEDRGDIGQVFEREEEAGTDGDGSELVHQ